MTAERPVGQASDQVAGCREPLDDDARVGEHAVDDEVVPAAVRVHDSIAPEDLVDAAVTSANLEVKVEPCAHKSEPVSERDWITGRLVANRAESTRAVALEIQFQQA